MLIDYTAMKCTCDATLGFKYSAGACVCATDKIFNLAGNACVTKTACGIGAKDGESGACICITDGDKPTPFINLAKTGCVAYDADTAKTGCGVGAIGDAG